MRQPDRVHLDARAPAAPLSVAARGWWPAFVRRVARDAGRAIAAVLDAVDGSPHALPPGEVRTAAAQPLVKASPRGNGYLTLEDGVRHFVSPHGLVGWVAHGSTVVVTGGVHGHRPAPLLRTFVAQARSHGWRRVLLFPVASEEREAVVSAGFEVLPVGSEAFIDPVSFDLRGKRRADLRQMVNRATRHGLRVAEVPGCAAGSVLDGVYRAWLRGRGGAPMRALVGSPAFLQPLERAYLAVFDGAGTPWAFVTLTPGWHGAGWGVDVMARHPAAPAGAMELLLVHAIEWARARGARHFTLSAVPLVVPADVRRALPLHLRAVFRLLYRSRLANALYRFEGLHRFKAKFAPRWAPVWMAGWPRMGVRALFEGCRAWGLVGTASPEAPAPAHPALARSLPE